MNDFYEIKLDICTKSSFRFEGARKVTMWKGGKAEVWRKGRLWNNNFMNRLKEFFLKPETKYIKLQTLR